MDLEQHQYLYTEDNQEIKYMGSLSIPELTNYSGLHKGTEF
jgi:hypothetical protein